MRRTSGAAIAPFSGAPLSTRSTLSIKCISKSCPQPWEPGKTKTAPGPCTSQGLELWDLFVFLLKERRITGEISHWSNRLQSSKHMCQKHREHIKEKKAKAQMASLPVPFLFLSSSRHTWSWWCSSSSSWTTTPHPGQQWSNTWNATGTDWKWRRPW